MVAHSPVFVPLHRLQNKQQLGQWGEEMALRFYQTQGFVLQAKNWRAGRLGEIDLIVYHAHPTHPLLVFVEVKTRQLRDRMYRIDGPQLTQSRPHHYSGAESGLDAIHPTKLARLHQVAEQYMATTVGCQDSGNCPSVQLLCRLDLLVVGYYPAFSSRPATSEPAASACSAAPAARGKFPVSVSGYRIFHYLNLSH